MRNIYNFPRLETIIYHYCVRPVPVLCVQIIFKHGWKLIQYVNLTQKAFNVGNWKMK